MALTTDGSIEQTFATWWGSFSQLTGAISESAVFVGDVQNDDQSLPYVVIQAESEARFRSNCGSGDTATVDVLVVSDSFSFGKTLSELVKDSMRDQTTSDAYLSVSQCRFAASSYEQQDDGNWVFLNQFTVDYQKA